MTKKITGALLLIAIAVLTVWDIVVATNEASGDTISEIVLALSLGNPIVPFAVGVVCGHLFWGQKVLVREDGSDVDTEGPTKPG